MLWLRRKLARWLGLVTIDELRRAERERDAAEALALKQHDDLMNIFEASVRKAERVQSDLADIRAQTIEIQETSDPEVQARCAVIRKHLHNLRGNL